MKLYEVTAILKSGREVVYEVETYSSFKARDTVEDEVDVERVVHVKDTLFRGAA